MSSGACQGLYFVSFSYFLLRILLLTGQEYYAVLLSTVMTCHTYTKDYETEPNFLSDGRVLNTALTRARSLAIVFGDADCLFDCKIGPTWRRYIEACLEAKSLLGQKWLSRKVSQLLAKRSQFNVDAPVFLPGRTKIDVVDPAGDVVDPAGDEDSSGDTDVEDSDESIVDCPSSDDEMAKIFHKDVVKPYIREEVLPSVQQTEAVKKVIVQDVAEDGDDVKLKSVRVKSKAVTRLDFYEEKEVSRETISRYTPHLNLREMEELCRKHPEKYRKCFLDVKPNYDEAYGVCINDEEEDILIEGRLRRNRAFDREPVLVEVLSTEDEGKCERSRPSGRVVGIFHKQRRERFLCKIHRNNPQLFVPLDQSQPPFWTKGKKSKAKASVSLFSVQRHGKRGIKPANSIQLPKVPDRLFVVEFGDWSRKFHFPLGLPVADISFGTNFESGRKILEIRHAVDDLISNPGFENDPDQGDPDPPVFTAVPESPVFTISSGKSRVIENAFGLQQKETGGWTVCVYVVDVAAKVREGGEVDKRAQALATTVLDHEDNVNVWMLPERISTVICSLQPGQKKQVIAGYFDFDANGKETGVPRFKETHIRSCCRFTYENVQDIILGSNPSFHCLDQDRKKLEQVYSDVRSLFALSVKWRTNRLRERRSFVDLNWEEHADARILVEELLLKMNCGVAENLLKKYHGNTILCCQANVRKCKASIADYYPLARLTGSVDLSLIKRDEETLREDNACETMSLPKELSRRISSLVLSDEFLSATDSMERLIYMLRCEERVPQLAACLSNYRKNLCDLIYVCSESENRFPTKRFDLGAFYAPFTSPVSNYVDLTLQRVMKKRKVPVRLDLSELCAQSNYRRRNAENFKMDLNLLAFSERLALYPTTFACVVESIQHNRLVLFFPACPQILFQNRSVTLSSLEAVRLDFVDSDSESDCSFVINWTMERLSDPSLINSEMVVQLPLPAEEEFVSIKGEHWKRLVNEATALDAIGAKEKVQNVVRKIQAFQTTNLVENDTGFDTQISGFSFNGECSSDDTDDDEADADAYDINDNSSFECTISTFDLLSVQLSSQVFEGLLQPFVQLVNFNNGLSVCVEHNEHPELCFSPMLPPGSLCVRKTFRDLSDYLEYWIRILQLELATTSVRDSATVAPSLIDNVVIDWCEGNGTWVGRAKLDALFVKENAIAYEQLNYACVRYFNVTTMKEPTEDSPPLALQEKYNEVLHCLVSNSYLDADENHMVIELKCCSSRPVQTTLFRDLKPDHPCMVQMIHSSLPIKYVKPSQ